MTFLEILNETIRQSGTVPSNELVTDVTTITDDRLQVIANYVNESWQDIQNAHRQWRWLRSRFTINTVAAQRAYAATAATDEVSSTLITRFSQWGFKDDNSDVSLSIYLTATGVSDEGSLIWRDWEVFYETCMRGTQTNGRPTIYSVDDANNLVLHPIPDAIYTLRGRYIKGPQALVANGTTPEMPARFHTIIKDCALIYLEGFDEGPRIPTSMMRKNPNWSMLEHDQLPRVSWGDPLA